MAATGLILLATGCHSRGALAHNAHVKPFTFQVSSGADNYRIAGDIALVAAPGRHPALLVLNAANSNPRGCIKANYGLTAMGLQVACINLPGSGGSSGPGRFVGPQAVAAAHKAVDLLAARPDVDPARIAVWGLSEGAVAAGLLMDSDPGVHFVVLQSGAYDMLSLWPKAPLTTKLSILHQVWPSKRVLKERSVVDHLPAKLDCSVLILHGERDRRTPVKQAQALAAALRKRGARVHAVYFPKGRHNLGKKVDPELRAFLRQNLLAAPNAAS